MEKELFTSKPLITFIVVVFVKLQNFLCILRIFGSDFPELVITIFNYKSGNKKTKLWFVILVSLMVYYCN